MLCSAVLQWEEGMEEDEVDEYTPPALNPAHWASLQRLTKLVLGSAHTGCAGQGRARA